jgi:hypothetical protein
MVFGCLGLCFKILSCIFYIFLYVCHFARIIITQHCLRTFQLNETKTLSTSCNDIIWNVCAGRNDKDGARIILKLELGLICYLTIAGLVFIRRSTNFGSNQSQMCSRVALLHCFHTSISA